VDGWNELLAFGYRSTSAAHLVYDQRLRNTKQTNPIPVAIDSRIGDLVFHSPLMWTIKVSAKQTVCVKE
jgi:hypothetical protein